MIRIYGLIMVLGLMIAAPVQGETAWETAISTDVKGKGGWFTCLNYSKDLYQKLSVKGHEAHLIIFEWKNEHLTTGKHAFVVYRDEKGRFFGMDNRLKQPLWLSGEAPKEWVNCFSKETNNKVLRHYYDTALVGRKP